MFIRSQTGKYLVETNGLVIEVIGTEVICFYISNISDSSYITLGKYMNEEDAMEVVNDIQIACFDHAVFQMPER